MLLLLTSLLGHPFPGRDESFGYSSREGDLRDGQGSPSRDWVSVPLFSKMPRFWSLRKRVCEMHCVGSSPLLTVPRYHGPVGGLFCFRLLSGSFLSAKSHVRLAPGVKFPSDLCKCDFGRVTLSELQFVQLEK